MEHKETTTKSVSVVCVESGSLRYLQLLPDTGAAGGPLAISETVMNLSSAGNSADTH